MTRTRGQGRVSCTSRRQTSSLDERTQQSPRQRSTAATGKGDEASAPDAATAAVKRRRLSDCAPGSPPDAATNIIAYWALRGHWPKRFTEISPMERLLAKKKSSSRKRSEPSASSAAVTPSDQRPREEKSASYRKSRYPLLLEIKGSSYMGKSPSGITDESKRLCQTLLVSDQPTPRGSIFDHDVFESACANLENKNEARIIQDITRLIVPSAETLALRVDGLKDLVESVNEGWNCSMPLTGTRPQPDYSVGFRRTTFTDEQLAKLSPFLGDFINGDHSKLMATYNMYFPFLTCEVKCGVAGLDIADRQNAHSMTLAARAIAELFRGLGRQDEIHRQILAFSVSHDHSSVRIYGHYPVIDGNDIKYYRHPIHRFDFSSPTGSDRWAAYRFTRNVYEIWTPEHYKRLCSAITQLPSDPDFAVSPLSQGYDDGSDRKASSQGCDKPVRSEIYDANELRATPGTSLTQGQMGAKRRKDKP
ncbi:hypothetical protein XA68_12822 [Ophiocordyceps unilateralis]|uniref:DUF7924 domain-containing protein n=1 Tax=Ophiocordyceps unilateralis TaxID=268505 RepID=A0A2A9PDU0_OPHUN|nr:hypothetical protein XA68_12822 [Ophiocordyceps unilateralis]